MSGDGTVPGPGPEPYGGGPSPYGAHDPDVAGPYGTDPYAAAPYPAAPYGSAPQASRYADPAWQGYAAPGGRAADPYASAYAGHAYAAYPPAQVRNSPATAGLVLGIIAMVINPLTVLSVLGIVFSGIGLSRAGALSRLGYGSVGRTRATWGLVLSILALGYSAIVKLFLF